MTRVIITGSREYTNEEELFNVLNSLNITHFVEGGAKGADALGYKWARRNLSPENIVTVRAEWDKYGSKAGPLRNQKMLDDYPPDLVVAFPTASSRGTWDMVRRAERAGVEVKIIGKTKRP